MNIWKSLLAVCLLIAMFGCGASASKKANQEGAAKQVARSVCDWYAIDE